MRADLLTPVPYAPPLWMGVIVFGIFSLGALVLFFGWAPITPFVRAGIDHHRAIAVALGLGLAVFLGALAGHFWR